VGQAIPLVNACKRIMQLQFAAWLFVDSRIQPVLVTSRKKKSRWDAVERQVFQEVGESGKTDKDGPKHQETPPEIVKATLVTLPEPEVEKQAV
jgi:hypothetical protein